MKLTARLSASLKKNFQINTITKATTHKQPIDITELNKMRDMLRNTTETLQNPYIREGNVRGKNLPPERPLVSEMIEYRSRDGSEPTQYMKTHRWPKGVLTHGGAYASLINIRKNKGPSGLNTDIYRHNPLKVSEII